MKLDVNTEKRFRVAGQFAIMADEESQDGGNFSGCGHEEGGKKNGENRRWWEGAMKSDSNESETIL